MILNFDSFVSEKMAEEPGETDKKEGLEGFLTPKDIAKENDVDVEIVDNLIKKGTKAELVHTEDKVLAREIAMTNLSKDLKHYDKLKEDAGAPAAGLATLASTPGMGQPVMASRGHAGSGDVEVGKKKKKRKKIRKWNDFFAESAPAAVYGGSMNPTEREPASSDIDGIPMMKHGDTGAAASYNEDDDQPRGNRRKRTAGGLPEEGDKVQFRQLERLRKFGGHG